MEFFKENRRMLWIMLGPLVLFIVFAMILGPSPNSTTNPNSNTSDTSAYSDSTSGAGFRGTDGDSNHQNKANSQTQSSIGANSSASDGLSAVTIIMSVGFLLFILWRIVSGNRFYMREPWLVA